MHKNVNEVERKEVNAQQANILVSNLFCYFK